VHYLKLIEVFCGLCPDTDKTTRSESRKFTVKGFAAAM